MDANAKKQPAGKRKGPANSKGRPKRGADELLAVLIARGETVADAVRATGLSDTTVRRRLVEPAFRARVAELRKEMVGRAIGQTAALLDAAVARLAKLVESKNEVVALGAVKEVTASHLKLRQEFDLAERLEELERAVGIRPPQHGKGEAKEGVGA